MSPIVFMIMWLVVLGLGSYVGFLKGRPVLGSVLTFFLGLIGLLIIAIVPGRPAASGLLGRGRPGADGRY